MERGAYIECMIELALRERQPAWSLTETWDRWDLENQKTRARIEIKQSAALANVAPLDLSSLRVGVRMGRPR